MRDRLACKSRGVNKKEARGFNPCYQVSRSEELQNNFILEKRKVQNRILKNSAIFKMRQ